MSPAEDSRRSALLALRSPDPIVRRRLGYGAFVGVRYPYLYLETPKVACTTTKTHLWHLERIGPLPYPNFAHARPDGDPRPSLLTIGEDRALEAMCGPSILRFCIWRDPVRRLASAYMAKIRLKRDPAPEWAHYREIIAGAFGMGSGDEITFDQFAHFACAQPDEARDPHFMSQWRLSLAEFIRYDRIVQVERYAQNMAEIYRALGVPISEWPDFDARRENFTGSETLRVSEATAAMIRETYRKDYEMAGISVAAPQRGIAF